MELHLDGKRYCPEKIARAVTLAENGSYMREYKEGPDGKIFTIDFRFVPDQN